MTTRTADDGRARTPETDRARLRELLALGPGHSGRAEAIVVGPDGAPVGSGMSVGRRTGAGAPALVGVRPAGAADDPAQDIPALLLRPAPQDDIGAGVVLIAGHGRGIDDLVRTDPADDYHGGLAHSLAAAGFTVLCPEMISFGRRRVPRPEGAAPYEDGENSCGIDAARHLLHGRPVMGARVADARLAASALRALDGIDPSRIAVAGGSGGGAVSLLLAATDESIAGALVATYFSSFAASICSIRHCPCNIIPGLLEAQGADGAGAAAGAGAGAAAGAGALEMADIAALVAPRALVLEAGERDPIFPIAATRESFAQIDPLGHAQLVVTGEGHRFVGDESVRLLADAMA